MPLVEATVAAIGEEVSLGENARTLETAAERVAGAAGPGEAVEAMWSAFCPDLVSIRNGWEDAVGALQARRTLTELRPPSLPIRPHEILVTANVLLDVPRRAAGLSDDEVGAAAAASTQEPVVWFDHPIPLDAADSRHEAVHGLTGFDKAVAFERGRGVLAARVPVVLSVSATRPAIDRVGRAHLARVLEGHDLPNLDVYAVTEEDAERIIDVSLLEALRRLGRPPDGARRVFGVNGPYGRHYSFLKGIAAWWSVLVDPRIRATFKFDLDQVFPQSQLVAGTGKSAFEHMAYPGWGGSAQDAAGRPVSLDYIAGALVNEADARKGLFVPDVIDPGPPGRPEQCILHSELARALSTEAEMSPEGAQPRQRIHVTGGTTGVTVAGLRRSRAFAPTFWGRAEDQVYLLSTWWTEPKPATLHVPGLVMRHDSGSLVGKPAASAIIDKLIADHERILMFSAYARHIDGDLASVKAELAPFTGAFVSPMPVTVSHLRIGATALSWAAEGRQAEAQRLFETGMRRLGRIRHFVGSKGGFLAELEADRSGWRDVHDALDLLEQALATSDPWALRCRDEAALAIEAMRLA